MNPGRQWWEAYLAAYQVYALDADCEDPVASAAEDADAGVEEYEARYTVSGQRVDDGQAMDED